MVINSYPVYKQNPSTQSRTRKASHLAKHVQETDVHCYAEKDLSKKRKAKHYPPLSSPSLSSQSDLVPSNASTSIQHNLVIFPPPPSTVQSGFLQAPYRPVRQNNIAAANAPGAALDWSGYPWNDETPPRRPIATAKYTRGEKERQKPRTTKTRRTRRTDDDTGWKG